MSRGALSFVRSGNDVRVVSFIVSVALVPFSFVWGDILHAERNASLNNFVHHLDREPKGALWTHRQRLCSSHAV